MKNANFAILLYLYLAGLNVDPIIECELSEDELSAATKPHPNDYPVCKNKLDCKFCICKDNENCKFEHHDFHIIRVSLYIEHCT